MAKRSIDGGEDLVGREMGEEHGRAELDADGPGAGGTSMDGPGIVSADDDGGDDGNLGAASDEDDAFFEAGDFTVLGARAFGVQIENVAFAEPLDAFTDGGDVAAFPALANGKTAQFAEEPGEGGGDFEEFGLGDVAQGAVEADAQEDGIEEALVVGDDQGAAGGVDVFGAVDFEVEEKRGKEMCHGAEGFPEDAVFGHGVCSVVRVVKRARRALWPGRGTGVACARSEPLVAGAWGGAVFHLFWRQAGAEALLTPGIPAKLALGDVARLQKRASPGNFAIPEPEVQRVR